MSDRPLDDGEPIGADETAEGLEMAGLAGIEIFPPTRKLADYGAGLVESTLPPWIKLSVSLRDRRLAQLKGSRLSVFICIALHIDEKNESWPSGETIAKETGYTVTEVWRAVKELEGLGLLSVTRQHRKANIYAVLSMAAMGNGNNPLGEVKSRKEVTQDTSQKSPQEEPVSRTKNTVAKPRDPLFDAICSVCQVDPATAGASVGKVKAALIKVSPPYSPEEVVMFGKLWFAEKWRSKPPTIWKLKEQIGLVRTLPINKRPEPIAVYE